MPPGLRLFQCNPRALLNSTPSISLTPFLVPSLASLRFIPQRTKQHQQQRAASILNQLKDNPAAYRKKKRVGRGPASGKGRTAGRGQNGQKARGKVPQGFNGGQTPKEVQMGLPRGFVNKFTDDLVPLNLDRVQSWIDQGRLDPSKTITVKELQQSRCLHGAKEGVKLLARNANELRTPITIIVSRASAAAIEAVERQGGHIATRYYTRFAIRNIMRGLMHPTVSAQSVAPTIPDAAVVDPTNMTKLYQYRLPDPTSRRDIEYYRDSSHRGYLSHLVKEGEGPSLYFWTPEQKAARKEARKRAVVDPSKVERKEQRLW